RGRDPRDARERQPPEGHRRGGALRPHRRHRQPWDHRDQSARDHGEGRGDLRPGTLERGAGGDGVHPRGARRRPRERHAPAGRRSGAAAQGGGARPRGGAEAGSLREDHPDPLTGRGYFLPAWAFFAGWASARLAFASGFFAGAGRASAAAGWAATRLARLCLSASMRSMTWARFTSGPTAVTSLPSTFWFTSMSPPCAGRMRTRLSLPRMTNFASATRPCACIASARSRYAFSPPLSGPR